jgi:hypothetical protein
MLHIVNGDSTRELLLSAGVPGLITLAADALHEGPAPADLPPRRWREIRARFHHETEGAPYEQALEQLEAWEAPLETAEEHDEVVLWFEHDLFDQLNLIRLLHTFAARPAVVTRLRLICLGEHPSVRRFVGLGQLSAQTLAALLPTRVAITRNQLELGRAAWNAFTSPDPTAIERVIAGTAGVAHVLPFLAGALVRHLEEFPAIDTGLGRSDRQILQAAAGGRPMRDLFTRVADLEDRPFMGDTTFAERVRRLAAAPSPLVTFDEASAGAWSHGRVATTTVGRAVLAGQADAVAINGIDRWLGGVRLSGRERIWRWDPRASQLTFV